MKKYSEIKFLRETFGTDDVKFEVINEGFLRDFAKSVKNKFFNDIVFVDGDKFNDLKYVFMLSLIRSLPFLKYQTFKISNIFFDPKKVIEAMIPELEKILEEERKGDLLRSTFSFKRSYRYRDNQSLYDDCEVLIGELKTWIEKNTMRFLNKVYQVGYKHGRNEDDMSNTLKSFISIFHAPLNPEMKETTDSNGNKKKVLKREAQLIRLAENILEKIEKYTKVKYINIFITTDEDVLSKIATTDRKTVNTDKVDDTPKIKKAPDEIEPTNNEQPDDVEVEEDDIYPDVKSEKTTPLEKDGIEDIEEVANKQANQIKSRDYINTLQSFASKNKIGIPTDDITGVYYDMYIAAYKDTFIKKKGIPSKTEVIKRMEELYLDGYVEDNKK